MVLLLTLSAAGILYLLQMLYHKKYWDRRLEVEIRFDRRAVNEGEDSSLHEVIINRKAFPLLTLQVKFSVSRKLLFKEAENTATTDNNYRNDIFSVLSYEKISRTLPFRAEKRGYYQIWDLDLISYDLFHSRKSLVSRDTDTALYVYPRPIPFVLIRAPFQKMMGTLLTRKSSYEDPFEFRGLRPYQPQDPMKDINWKATARAGEFVVNVHDYTASRQVTIFLNLADDSSWHYERLFEDAIRLADTFAEQFLSQGIPVRLISNGTDVLTKEEFVLSAGAGLHHIRSMKEGLARLSDRCQDLKDLTPAITGELAGGHSTDLYLLISYSQKQGLLQAFDLLCRKASGSRWIAPLFKDMDFLPERCPAADPLRWEVSRIA